MKYCHENHQKTYQRGYTRGGYTIITFQTPPNPQQEPFIINPDIEIKEEIWSSKLKRHIEEKQTHGDFQFLEMLFEISIKTWLLLRRKLRRKICSQIFEKLTFFGDNFFRFFVAEFLQPISNVRYFKISERRSGSVLESRYEVTEKPINDTLKSY